MSIYMKTPRGQEELDHRTHALGLRARRLLILIDGERPTEELARLSGDAELEARLSMLVERGFIARAGGEKAAGAGAVAARSSLQAPAAPLAPARSSAAAQPPVTQAPPGGGNVELARDFMMNTLRTFNGPYGKLDLVKRIHASSAREDLHAMYDEWLRAISESRIGRKRADELSARLLEVL
ncbi:hypothetical protein [Thauera phenolivorans]|uniref:hypothetical protein n=1 Tax=Thauera phenolivorans TaxID=1792543 RepID=UPI00083B8304|nr:hypothetical protein [Thauera phenolivorans]